MESPAPHPPHKQENGLAIASLVLGIISLTGAGALTGVPAIITGTMSMKNPHNKGLGVAGLVMGIISTVLTVLFVLFFVMVFMFAAAADAPSTEPYPLNDSSYPTDSSVQRQI